MAEQPFPLQKPNDMPLETYLLHLLAAIVKKSGGELRLTCQDIISATGSALTRHPSERNDAVILRATPKGTDTYFVKEAPSWTAPQPTRTKAVVPQPNRPAVETQHHESVPKTSRSRQLDDMAMYLKEQEIAEHQAELLEQGRDPREFGMYPWRVKTEQ